MPLVIRSSDLRKPDRAAVAVARKVEGVERPPLLWPRWVKTGPNSGRTVMVPIDPDMIPPGWQAVRASVPMRLASCAETDCPLYLAGWSEIVTGDGNRIERVGHISVEEAAGITGYFGAAALPPTVIHHPPERPCGRIHKVPNGQPPIYEVNGRPTLWNEFEDALAGGVHQTARLIAEGKL